MITGILLPLDLLFPFPFPVPLPFAPFFTPAFTFAGRDSSSDSSSSSSDLSSISMSSKLNSSSSDFLGFAAGAGFEGLTAFAPFPAVLPLDDAALATNTSEHFEQRIFLPSLLASEIANFAEQPGH